MSFLSFTVTAATLTVGDNLVLRDVDDKAVESSFLSRNETVNLSQGSHTLVVKYKDVFEDFDFIDERLVTSDYFVVKFLIEKQQSLVLSTTKIKDLAAAERFVRNPELILLDERKQEMVLALEKLSDYELAKQVTQVVTTLSAPVGVSKSSIEAIKENNNKQGFSKEVINQVDTVPMLKYWWKKANQDEKQNFLHFINKNKSNDSNNND
jgi:uncharacterized protein YccT (UPF0319 family)